MFAEAEVDRLSADVHVPRRQLGLTRPLTQTLEAGKVDLLGVRDVRHDDVGRPKRFLHRLRRLLRGRRLLCTRAVWKRERADATERGKGNQAGRNGRTHFHDLINKGSITVDRKKNVAKLISAATAGSFRTRMTSSA